MLLGSSGSILLGLPYLLYAFGPTEAEVARWGLASVAIGLALWPLGMIAWCGGGRIVKILAVLGYGLLALLQILPIFLWFSFHGYGISDGTPSSAFVAHWVYAGPHIALLILSGAVLVAAFIKGPEQPGTGSVK